MSLRMGLRYIIVFVLSAQLFYATPIWAFPPYKTTDADTADPYTLELRLGLIQLEREDGVNEYISPLLRTNFGLPNKVELISEFEYLPEADEFGDGAVGFKWVPVFGTFSLGIETLVLLPVRRGDDGAGIESQLLATWRNDDMQVHINAGGFHDARTSLTEDGWRASVLTEVTYDRFRPGIELFAKQVNGEDADVRMGTGVRIDMGRFDIRSGIHFGLTHEAPDVVFNLWISTKFPFR